MTFPQDIDTNLCGVVICKPNLVATGLGSYFSLVSELPSKLSRIIDGVLRGMYPTPKLISGT